MTEEKYPTALETLDVSLIVDLKNAQSMLTALIHKIGNAAIVERPSKERLLYAYSLVQKFRDYLNAEESSNVQEVVDSLKSIQQSISEYEMSYYIIENLLEDPTNESKG